MAWWKEKAIENIFLENVTKLYQDKLVPFLHTSILSNPSEIYTLVVDFFFTRQQRQQEKMTARSSVM